MIDSVFNVLEKVVIVVVVVTVCGFLYSVVTTLKYWAREGRCDANDKNGA